MIQIDSVPIFQAEASGPVRGALYFRVGMADENFGNHGITHLVEHLAFNGLLDKSVHSNGMTTDTFTCFYTSGTREEVINFLTQICTNLSNLPLDRVEKEKDILRTEETRRGGAVGEARSTLHGFQDYGLAGVNEIGLNRVSAEEVARWAATYFTCANAAGFITCTDDLGDLRLPLPAGVRQVVPEPSLNPAADPLPRHYPYPSNAVVVEALVERGAAVRVMVELAKARFWREAREIDALSYSLSVDTSPVGTNLSRFSCFADTVPENGPGLAGCLTDCLSALCAGQFTDEELSQAIASAVKSFEDENAEAAMLATHVLNNLFSRPVETLDGVRSGCAGVTRDDIVAMSKSIEAHAIWVTPASDLEWAGIKSCNFFVPGVNGHEFPRIGAPGKFIVSDKGVTMDTGRGSTWTVLFSQCVGVETYPDGLRAIVGLTGAMVSIEPNLYQGLTPALTSALVDSRVSGDRLIPMPPRRPNEIPTPPEPEVASPGQYPAGASSPGSVGAQGFAPPTSAPGADQAINVGSVSVSAPAPAPGSAYPGTDGSYPNVVPGQPMVPQSRPKKKGILALFIVLSIVFGLAALLSLLFILVTIGDSDPDAGTARIVFGILLALTGIPAAIFIWQAVRSNRM